MITKTAILQYKCENVSWYGRKKGNVQAILENREVMLQRFRDNRVYHRGSTRGKRKSRMPTLTIYGTPTVKKFRLG